LFGSVGEADRHEEEGGSLSGGDPLERGGGTHLSPRRNGDVKGGAPGKKIASKRCKAPQYGKQRRGRNSSPPITRKRCGAVMEEEGDRAPQFLPGGGLFSAILSRRGEGKGEMLQTKKGGGAKVKKVG